MNFYTFVGIINSIEFMMAIDRELYELRTDNKTNTAALRMVF